jgi:hypothetical protein
MLLPEDGSTAADHPEDRITPVVSSHSPELLQQEAGEDLSECDCGLSAGGLHDMSQRVRHVFKEMLSDVSESPVIVPVSSQPALRRTRAERALHRDMIREFGAELLPEARGEVPLPSESSPDRHVRDLPVVSDGTCESASEVAPDSGEVCVFENTIDPLCQLMDALHLSSAKEAVSNEASNQASFASDADPAVSLPDEPACTEPCPSVKLARAKSESTSEMDKLRRVRIKVVRDVWAAQQGASD